MDFPVELYRVADVDENDVYTATKQFDELAKSISDISSKTTADDWEKMAKTAADIADKGSLTADEVIDVSNGRGNVTGVKTGLYLVYAKPANSARFGYTFVPYLVSAPNNEFAMTGSGSDSWIYDDIDIDLKPEQTGLMGSLQINKTLKTYNTALGEPVSTFTWSLKGGEAKEYTPLSFYKEFLGNDLTNNYVMLMNDPSREFYKCYEIDYDRHSYDGKNWTYVNLPIEDIKEIAIASIKDSTMMYFSCDVGKFLDSKRGLLDPDNYDYESLMGTTFGMDKKQRIQTFASGSSHAMTLMAVDLDKAGKPKKWMVENSWGSTNGYKGHLIMTDKWFDEYMFRVVAEKKYVPAKVLDILKQKPIRLPAWDPMFANEE